MLAMSFGILPEQLDRVALHYQEERRVILMAQYEAKVHKQNAAIKAGAQNIEVFLPEF